MEMHGLHDVVTALCRLPITYHQRGDVSEVDLITEIGYAEHAAEITEGLLDEHIRAHPELLDIWVQYSEDQRCSPAWVLSGRNTVGDPTEDWHVSYWDHDPAKRSDQVFPDQFAACAFFVKRRADSLMRNAMTQVASPPGPVWE